MLKSIDLGHNQSIKMFPLIRRRRFPRFTIFFASKVNGAVNVQQHRWSTAAAVSSEIRRVREKGSKKIPKAERRVMVESYVNKYREKHGGRFPSVTDTIKEVGGGFYFLRQILQELEYISKMSSSKGRKENLEKDLIEKSKLLTEVETNRETVDARTQLDSPTSNVTEVGYSKDTDLEVVEDLLSSEKTLLEETSRIEGNNKSVSPFSEILEGGEEKEACNDNTNFSSTSSEKEAYNDNTNFSSTSSQSQKKNIDDNHLLKLDDSTKEKTQIGFSHVIEDATKSISREYIVKAEVDPKLSDSENLVDNKRSTHEDKISQRDIYERGGKDAELQKKSTLWGNLKSFADGFINMWRKL
ncbi:hypothetical protein K2173_014168 [Erythroxylum novogranatense]|uniref:AT3G52170-like helix-turn-helix domain-containing protein n=1 Tax=Erythroxylum novogranatense TaxID=1862640 RepID=A0AAV8SDK2_9ROSI|nr:hypothetical protein K2173_014168 [Erythroxylum novogranatense]